MLFEGVGEEKGREKEEKRCVRERERKKTRRAGRKKKFQLENVKKAELSLFIRWIPKTDEETA